MHQRHPRARFRPVRSVCRRPVHERRYVFLRSKTLAKQGANPRLARVVAISTAGGLAWAYVASPNYEADVTDKRDAFQAGRDRCEPTYRQSDRARIRP